MYRLALILSVALGLWGSPAIAKDTKSSTWIVSQLSGDARVLHGGLRPASLTVNSRLAPGDIILTGTTGRATLSRDADYIVIAPRSELRLPSTPQPNGFTRVMQNLGTMLFKVQHTGVPHFAVDTPMLAAVVKGTTFTVVVDRDRSAVQVTQGVVEVTATDGGMRKLVQGGKTIFINRGDPKKLIDADALPSDAPAATSDNVVAIVGSGDKPLQLIAGETAGLVRADTTSNASLIEAKPITIGRVATISPGTPSTSAPGATTTVSDPVASPAPTVTTPTVTTPTVTTPTVTTPTVTTPTVTTPVATVPSVKVPTITVPTVTVPTLTVPTVTVPTVAVPTVTVPTVTVPTVTVPTVTVPTVTVPTVTVPTVTLPPLRLGH